MEVYKTFDMLINEPWGRVAYLIKEGLPCHVKDINLHIIVVYPESEQKCAYVFTNNADYQFQISSPLFLSPFLACEGIYLYYIQGGLEIEVKITANMLSYIILFFLPLPPSFPPPLPLPWPLVWWSQLFSPCDSKINAKGGHVLGYKPLLTVPFDDTALQDKRKLLVSCHMLACTVGSLSRTLLLPYW